MQKRETIGHATSDPTGSVDATQPARLYTLRRIWRTVRPFYAGFEWTIPIVVLCGVVASFAEGMGVGVLLVLLASVFGNGESSIADDEEFGVVGQWLGSSLDDRPTLLGAALLTLVLVRIASVTAHNLLAGSIDARVSERVRKALFSRLLHMPYGVLAQKEYGQLATLLDRHAWSVAEAMFCLADMLMNSIAALFIGVLIMMTSWLTALVAALGALTLSLVLQLLQAPVERAGSEVAHLTQRINARTLRTLQAMRSIRAFAQEQHHQRGFDVESEALTAASIRSERLNTSMEPLSHAVYLVLLALIALVAHWNKLSYGAVAAAIALIYRMQPYVTAVQEHRIQLANLTAGIDAVSQLLMESQAAAPAGAQPYRGLRNAIRFEGVSFRYPGQRNVCLEGLNLTIPARGWTTLEGPSGVGKSSLVGLLLRLYAPSSGTISVDGTFLSEIRRESWLHAIAVAGQDIDLMDGTIADNLRLARPEASCQELREAARVAAIADFIDGLPLGYQTRVGERGLSLSGGQRQRIGIARALLAKPDLLILDEATNALDTDTERRVLQNIAELMSGRAVLLIAHGLRTQVSVVQRVKLPMHSSWNASEQTV